MDASGSGYVATVLRDIREPSESGEPVKIVKLVNLEKGELLLRYFEQF